MLLWMHLGCLTPTACPDACQVMADECGLGAGLEECTQACRRVVRADYQRRDLSYCVALQDCGELATGECRGQENHCGRAPAYVHVALSEECGAAPGSQRGVYLVAGCSYESAGDWGALGEPSVVEQVGSLALPGLDFGGDCVLTLDDEMQCMVDGQSCLVVTREVF